MPSDYDYDYEDDDYLDDEDCSPKASSQNLDFFKSQMLNLTDKINEQKNLIKKIEALPFIKVFIYYIGTTNEIAQIPKVKVEESFKVLNFDDYEKTVIEDYIHQQNVLIELIKNYNFFASEIERVNQEAQEAKKADMTIFNTLEKIIIEKHNKNKSEDKK